VPFSPEFRDLSPNEGLLREVADITGGRWLDDATNKPGDANIFSHDLPPSVSRRPAWDWALAWLFLPAFLLDVAVRRLASWLAFSIAVEAVVLVVLLFGFDVRYAPWWGVVGAFVLAELVGWSIRFRSIGPMFEFFTHGVTALAQTGERSEASLEKLRTKREQVKEELTTPSRRAGRSIAEEVEPASPATTKRRFDAGGEGGTERAGDLGETLGGAKASQTTGESEKPADKADDGGEGATSRLLRAKKRARDERDQRH
jgi:hypothetical protein